MVPPEAGLDSSEARDRLGMLEGWVSTGVSVALAAAKGVLAWLSGSMSLLADAVNNAADIASSLVVILGFHMARKPRDAEHPYGHGRMETVAGLILAVTLVMVAVEVARSGVDRLLHPSPVVAPPWVLVAVGLTIALKAWLALFARRLAALTGATVLWADAWNHFFDILCTSLVFLALIGVRIGWPAIDGWGGVGVSGFIFYTGFRYIRKTVGVLLGEAPERDDLRTVRRLAEQVPGVESVHDILIHDYGRMRLVTFHVEVDAALTALQSHAIAEAAEARVAAGLQAKVTVHADPVDRSHPDYARIAAVFHRLAEGDLGVQSYHDLRVAGDRVAGLEVEVDWVVEDAVPTARYEELADRVRERVNGEVDGVRRVRFGVESVYASAPEFIKEYTLRP